MLNSPLTFLPLPGAAPREEPGPAFPAMPAPGIRVEVLTTAEAFAELAPAWNPLHADSAIASVFTSWIWQFQWWQVYGRGRQLRLLVAFAGEEIVGILPLYVHPVRIFGVRVRLLRLVGTGGDTHPDDLGAVLGRAHAHGAAHALARAALALRDADVLLLTDLSPECPLRSAMESAARLAGRPLGSCTSERIAFLELPATWQEFLASLGRDRRWRLRRARRRLAEQHRARFFVWDDSAALDRAVDRLAELHRMRWAASRESRAFASSAYLDFHRNIIKSFFARRWLRLYCLEVDGAIGAMIYCYRFRNRVYLMQAGFDPRLARLGPGKVLLGHALEHAIGEGNGVFDFLRGEHRYKEELATAHRETVCLCAFARSVGGFAYRLRRFWLPLLKAWLLRRPPPTLNLS